ncbi:hypothetical protein I7I50_12635 [Histoplasma capsulatum G186AR]|uniref:Uncharacterized protein n=1 Tax=Ajellomyces capsulatus TaxID=5037 RepID=A0A8H7YCH3_AJECA|nr:hypothetical protein I7I52_11060 [Histoplasma capsulatum]QSS70864.1 hypothetical protein I7I50_12635 [Histoplasma capsulatum G186AR]
MYKSYSVGTNTAVTCPYPDNQILRLENAASPFSFQCNTPLPTYLDCEVDFLVFAILNPSEFLANSAAGIQC